MMFCRDSPWATEWVHRIIPSIRQLVERSPDRTAFTRFIPPRRADQRPGRWSAYFSRWRQMTLEQMDPRLVEIVPELAVFSPPAGTFDKSFYSVFSSRALGAWLSSLNIDTLIFSGVETDICVLISVLNAVDRGYRVIVATDAICSSSDKFHEELRALYECRFSEQVETALVEEILHRWE